MIWALIEIILPLIMAVVLGVFIGWLLWRWRRRMITADEWSRHLIPQQSYPDSTEAVDTGSDVSAKRADTVTDTDVKGNLQQRENLVQQLNALSAKHNSQKVQLSSVEKSAALLTRELEVTRQRLTKQSLLRARLSENESRLGLLQSEADTQKAHTQQLVLEKEQLTTEVERLASENKQLVKEVHDKGAALQLVQSDGRNELVAANARLSVLEEKLASAESIDREFADLKKQEASWREEQRELQGKLAVTKQDADTLSLVKKNLEALQNQQTAVNKEATEAKAQLASVEVRYSDLEQQYKDAVVSVTEAQAKINGLDEQHRELQQANKEINRQLLVAQSKTENLEVANKQLILEQQQSEVAIQNLTTELSQVMPPSSNDDRAGLEKQLSRLKQKESSLLQSNKELQEKLKATARDREDLMQAKTQLAALQGQYRSVSNKAERFDKTERENSELQAELSRLRNESDALKSELDSTTQAQKDSLSRSADVDRLNAKLDSEIRRSTEKEEQLRRSVAEVEALTTQLEASKRTIVKSAELEQELRQELRQKLQVQSQPANVEKSTGSSDSPANAAALADSKLQIAKLQDQLSQSQKLSVELAKAKEEIGSLEKQLEGFYMDSVATTPKSRSNPKFSAVVTKAIQSASNESSTMDEENPGDTTVQPLRPENPEVELALKSKNRATKENTGRSDNNSWQQGTTKLGTAGAAHQDDLKVISGIGPVLEKTLNSFDIISWEQLATLTSDEITVVDKAIAFPGRIRREQWKEQAAELVAQFPDKEDRPTKKTYAKRQAKSQG